MAGNRIATWRVAALLGVLGMITFVLVIPQVDLPETAFYEGNAPVVARLSSSATPAIVVIAVRAQFEMVSEARASAREHLTVPAHLSANSLPIFLSTLLC